ncbi:DUF3375 domain-containing protein [Endozoicomonas sp. 4G]|uniref:DUF3375 domain-containing protein n=1 Tax=Endozoicomonas sp. 4G TaxID=2872754 RepID=UPI00207883AA|nr:DUF3375 domain-containing protein [Endozoicomonas sp. 4G]
MSFQQKYASFRRQYQEHKTWKLLRADNAPLMLAFIADLFQETGEVPVGQARVALDTELQQLRELSLIEGDVNAMSYLRVWIKSGWLRELDDKLSRTDACEVALRFVKGLDERENNATASHLRIVQDAIRDLAVALSPDPKERVTLLEAKKAKLQHEIDALNAGVVYELSKQEQKERIREVYQLASVLTGDFRRVEDEIRQLDQQLRINMIEAEHHRGDILKALLDGENILAESDAGRAFDSFFQLLCDENRRLEFREQIRSVLSRPASNYLSHEQSRFLERLLRELTYESEHVFQVRKRTEESLRRYVESGAHLESRAVSRLLEQLEQTALTFQEQNISLKTDIGLKLNSGSAKVQSLDSLVLRAPDETLDTSEVKTNKNQSSPSASMLSYLQSVKVMELAEIIKSILLQNGPLTIAGIVQHYPVTKGLEELVAHLRVAKAIKATLLPDREHISLQDKEGTSLQATIPCYLLSSDQFPQRMEDLTL